MTWALLNTSAEAHPQFHLAATVLRRFFWACTPASSASMSSGKAAADASPGEESDFSGSDAEEASW